MSSEESREGYSIAAAFVRGIVGLLLVAIISSIASGMPEITNANWGGFPALTLVHASATVIALVVLGTLWTPATFALTHLLFQVVQWSKPSPNLRRSGAGVAGGVVSLIYVVIIYTSAMPSVHDFVVSYPSFNWLPSTITLALLAAAVIAAVQIYIAAGQFVEMLARERHLHRNIALERDNG